MRIQFWGVRGSIPAPGPETNRYGGNTACVSVHTESDELIIIDMGTGLVRLGETLIKREFGQGQGRATVLLSHSHWDHIQGFPFFAPVFVPGNQFVVYGNAQSPAMLEGILEGQMNPHYSPIYTLKNLGASIEFRVVQHGEYFDIGNVRVCARPNPHGATTALAFRLQAGDRSFVYASDVGYEQGGPSPEIMSLYRDADLFLHDCTYTPEDQITRRERGYSSYADAAAAAVAARAKRLIMFHYDQDYSDEMVDQLVISCRNTLDELGGTDIELTAAAEGMCIEL